MAKLLEIAKLDNINTTVPSVSANLSLDINSTVAFNLKEENVKLDINTTIHNAAANPSLEISSTVASVLKVVLIGLACLTMFFNGLLILAPVVRKRQSSIKPWFQQLLFLLINDFSVGLSQFIQYIFSDMGINVHVCRFTLSFYIGTQVVSTVNILAFTIRRYMSVRNLHKMNIPHSKNLTVAQLLLNVLVIIMTFSYIAAMYTPIENGYIYLKYCIIVEVFGEHSTKILALPVIVSAICIVGTNSLCIVCLRKLVWSSRSRVTAPNTLNFTQRKLNERRAIITLILIIIALDFFSIPTLFSAVLMGFKIEVPFVVLRIITNFGSCNSLLNPIIYVCRIKTLRESIFGNTSSS